MGGAFIALADDATATEFNPAGLWQLRTPEAALQVIYTREKQREPLLGRTFLEDESIFQNTTNEYPIIPSFASYVYPMQHLVLGLTEFTNVYFDRSYKDSDVDFSTGEVVDFTGRDTGANYAYGLTLASGIVGDVVGGVTLRYNTFRFESDLGLVGGSESFHSEAFSANAGLLWNFHPNLRIVAIYKSPQKLEGDYRGLDVDTQLPDTLGLGLAFLPDKRWRFLLDIDHIWWSKFDPNENDDFEKQDVWRYHAGAEWYAGRIKDTGVFLRAGYFYEDSNAFYYRGDNPLIAGLVPEPDPIHHYSFGLGLARRQYQLDFGIDLTNEDTIDLIVSTVVYF